MDKKALYKKVKTELAQRKSNIRYFNFKFFEQYLNAKNRYLANLKNGIDDSYKNGIVTLFHCFDEVYNSKFYTDNGCAYCTFLEVINPYIKKYFE